MSAPSNQLDRIVQLEQVFSHQEQLIEQLNQVIVQLRGELDALKQKFDEQAIQTQWLIDNLPGDGRSIEDEKPPHY